MELSMIDVFVCRSCAPYLKISKSQLFFFIIIRIIRVELPDLANENIKLVYSETRV